MTSGREIIFRCQFHTDAVENNFLRLQKSQLDEACRGQVADYVVVVVIVVVAVATVVVAVAVIATVFVTVAVD